MFFIMNPLVIMAGKWKLLIFDDFPLTLCDFGHFQLPIFHKNQLRLPASVVIMNSGPTSRGVQVASG
jgi:hypothetical protein